MKKHAIIPVFLPHEGCPNDCVFCNQKVITARPGLPEPAAFRTMVDTYLETISGRGIETVEIAFFGGSFTGMPDAVQNTYLEIAGIYKSRGSIGKIRLSTRPDYIDDRILENLRSHSVDIIELGVQSLDDTVLRLSNRGHDCAAVYESAALIKSYGFELGIQLMIGLPGDSREKCVASAEKAAAIGPSIARIYPTVILRGTELEQMYINGDYRPLDQDEAIVTAKAMCLILRKAGVNVIRIGLKSSDFIAEGREALGGTYHPAFRQLVESEIVKDILEAQLNGLLAELTSNPGEFSSVFHESPPRRICFMGDSDSLSDMIGHKKSNRLYFEQKYSPMEFTFKTDTSLEKGSFRTMAL